MSASRLQKMGIHQHAAAVPASVRTVDLPAVRHVRPAMRPITACIIAALVAGHVPMVVAASLPVTSCADDGGAGTLRSVVASAASGDTVDLSGLSCATITLASGAIPVHVASLTILGPGQDELTIDGDHIDRVFLHDGAGTLTLNAITLASGSAASNIPNANQGAYGGCILSTSLNPAAIISLVDATVTSCEAVNNPGVFQVQGGAVWAPEIKMTRSTASNNTASGIDPTGVAPNRNASGGALFARLAGITLVDSVISGNRAVNNNNAGASGGGVITRGSVSATNSIIQDNFVGCENSSDCNLVSGGGIHMSGTGGVTLTLASSLVSGNIASGKTVKGGGLLVTNYSGQSLITDTTISDNAIMTTTTGTGKGGGLYLSFYGSRMSITGSTISGNSAPTSGGGINDAFSQLILSNSTVSANSSETGGGIFVAGSSGYASTGPMTVTNSTITANIATGWSGGAGIRDTHTSGGSSTLQSTIVADNIAELDPTHADMRTGTLAITGANSLVIAAADVTLPADTLNVEPMLGPLQDNGGPTFTHALLAGSPAIDAGNNAGNLDTDQRGSGFARAFGATTDIGAFEVQPMPDVAKSFEPRTVAFHGAATSMLTITLTNPTDSDATLGADLVDPLPPPMVVADPSDAATTCAGGTPGADAGSASVTLGRGAVIPAGGSCAVSVTVTVGLTGVYTNTIAAGALRTDRGVNAEPAIADLTVEPDQPPVANKDSYEAVTGTALKVVAPGLLDNDSDPDGDALTAVLATSPTHGTLWLDASGAFVYLPVPGFTGTDTFTYRASDGYLDSNTASVTITVNPPANQLPAAANDYYTTAENAALTVDAPGVLGNDTDADGDTLTAVLLGQPSHGILSLDANGSFVYTPNDGFVGTDTFTYFANDGQLNSAAATVTITVKEVNLPPVAAGDSYTTAEDTALAVDAPGVLANDSDPDGDTLTAVLVDGPLHGTLTLDPNGGFVYVPVQGFVGSDAFTYEASDGQLSSDAATVTITVKQGTGDTIFANGFDGQ